MAASACKYSVGFFSKKQASEAYLQREMKHSGIGDCPEHHGDSYHSKKSSRLVQTTCETKDKSILKKQELYTASVLIFAKSCADAITKAAAIPRQVEDITLPIVSMSLTVSFYLVYALVIDYKPRSRMYQCKADAAVGIIKSVTQSPEIDPYVGQDETPLTAVSDRNIPCCQKVPARQGNINYAGHKYEVVKNGVMYISNIDPRFEKKGDDDSYSNGRNDRRLAIRVPHREKVKSEGKPKLRDSQLNSSGATCDSNRLVQAASEQEAVKETESTHSHVSSTGRTADKTKGLSDAQLSMAPSGCTTAVSLDSTTYSADTNQSEPTVDSNKLNRSSTLCASGLVSKGKAMRSADLREAYYSQADEERPIVSHSESQQERSVDRQNETAQCHSSSCSSSVSKMCLDVTEIRQFTYAAIRIATDDFNATLWKDGGRRLGQGSFGVVYYGLFDSEKESEQPLEFAVKRLKQADNGKQERNQGLFKKQFSNEIQALCRIRHHNIIRLHGLCNDGPELCLVYEYVPGGTLAQCLLKTSRKSPDGKVRVSIADGLARGLKYLHTRCTPPLIHRDIKSSNILLCNDWTPKLADFGLCRRAESIESAVFDVTSAVGTRAYMAPEALKGYVSSKVDVYSYGMILYELMTGLPPYSSSMKIDLVLYMHDMEADGHDVTVMVDPRTRWCSSVVEKTLKLARRCSDFDSSKRPRMREVVQELGRYSNFW